MRYRRGVRRLSLEKFADLSSRFFISGQQNFPSWLEESFDSGDTADPSSLNMRYCVTVIIILGVALTFSVWANFHSSTERSVPSATAQRFVPVSGTGFDAGLALDTKTGQLCKTVDWKPGLGMPNVAVDAPTCLKLYNEDH